MTEIISSDSVSIPQSVFVARMGEREVLLTTTSRFTATHDAGNFYIRSVFYQHCASTETSSAHRGECSSTRLGWGATANLLKETNVNIDLTKGIGILNPSLQIRHNGGDPIGTVRRESVTFDSGLTIPDAARIDIVIEGTTFVIAEGFDTHGRNVYDGDPSTLSGKAFVDKNMKSNFFAVGWGEPHFVTDFNQAKSNPSNGLYVYDFIVAINDENQDTLFYRTYLKLMNDDGSPIILTYAPSSGYLCCG